MGVERLLKDISKSFREWDEISQFKLIGDILMKMNYRRDKYEFKN